MGAGNVKAVYDYWSHFGDQAHRALVYMAVVSMDHDTPPVYKAGRDALADAIGRPIPSADNPRHHAAATRRVERLIATLRRSGVITVARRAAPGRPTHYHLHLRPTAADGRTPDTTPDSSPNTDPNARHDARQSATPDTRQSTSADGPTPDTSPDARQPLPDDTPTDTRHSPSGDGETPDTQRRPSDDDGPQTPDSECRQRPTLTVADTRQPPSGEEPQNPSATPENPGPEYRGVREEEGGSLPPAAAAEDPGPEPPSQCPKHHGLSDPPPCGPCADARRHHNQWTHDAARADARRRSAEARARAEARQTAIARCHLCDHRGYRNGTWCNHDPDQPARTRRGAATAAANIRPGPGARKPNTNQPTGLNRLHQLETPDTEQEAA